MVGHLDSRISICLGQQPLKQFPKDHQLQTSLPEMSHGRRGIFLPGIWMFRNYIPSFEKLFFKVRVLSYLFSASSKTIWMISMGTLPLSYMLPPNHSFHTIFIQMNGTFFFPKAQEFMSKFKVMTYNTGIWGEKHLLPIFPHPNIPPTC